jgi:threonine/homoserine/homoserine lactone efflux protein
VLYIVTRRLAHGRRAGITSVSGVALGNLGNAIAASVGLAALFGISALAFTVVKYAGALYLVFLGLRTLRSEEKLQAVPRSASGVQIFRDGFFVALLNPKTAIFFAAFLPQFLSTKTPSVVHTTVLGALFVAIAAVTDSAYALTAGMIGPALTRIQHARALGRYFSASALIGLGAFSAFTGSRHGK